MTTIKISTDPPGATYAGAGSKAEVGNQCFVSVPWTASQAQRRRSLLARLFSDASRKPLDREAGG